MRRLSFARRKDSVRIFFNPRLHFSDRGVDNLSCPPQRSISTDDSRLVALPPRGGDERAVRQIPHRAGPDLHAHGVAGCVVLDVIPPEALRGLSHLVVFALGVEPSS